MSKGKYREGTTYDLAEFLKAQLPEVFIGDGPMITPVSLEISIYEIRLFSGLKQDIQLLLERYHKISKVEYGVIYSSGKFIIHKT